MAKEHSIIPTKKLDTSAMLAKLPPVNIEAEKSVLGALLLHDEHINTVLEILKVEDWYSTAHRAIYKAMLELHSNRKRIDLVALQDELIKSGTLEVAGGLAYLLDLQEKIDAVGMIEQHAHIIKEKSTLRELINSAASIIGRCYDQDNKGIDVVLDEAEKTIFGITNKRTNQSFTQLNIWLKKTFQHLSDIKSHSRGVTGVASGYHQLDQMSSGFQSSDFIVLAARPSMGKTALALGIANYAAASGHTVGFFSLEMSAEQLTLRLLSAESGIAHHNIRNASISSQEWVSLTTAAARMAETKLFIDDTAMLTIMELRAKARKLKAEHNLQLLVIDYLQLIHTNKRHENRHQEVSEISRSLKALAKELKIPIIALSQLSRAVDSRMDKRPMLSDLRESGAIEQDADLIMFLYRDVVYNPDTQDPAQAELIIGKQRNGPTGTVLLHFAKERTTFENSGYSSY
jgi:replicative DNA helicase